MKIKTYIGVIGAGKDYRCSKECTHKISFADGVREDVWKILGWKPETDVEYEAFKTTLFYPTGLKAAISYSQDNILQVTGREILQNYGSLMKELHGEDYWAVRIWPVLENLQHNSTETIVGITDCRYKTEIKALLDFADFFNCTVEFLHCDYKSDRYNATDPHHSEHLAQQFAGKVYEPKEFNDLIYEMYGQ